MSLNGRNSLDWLPQSPRSHQLTLPHPRFSPGFFASLWIHAIGHSAEVPRRTRPSTIAVDARAQAHSLRGGTGNVFSRLGTIVTGGWRETVGPVTGSPF